MLLFFTFNSSHKSLVCSFSVFIFPSKINFIALTLIWSTGIITVIFLLFSFTVLSFSFFYSIINCSSSIESHIDKNLFFLILLNNIFFHILN